MSNKGPGAHLNTSGAYSEACRSGQLTGVSSRPHVFELSASVFGFTVITHHHVSLVMSYFLNENSKVFLRIFLFPPTANRYNLRLWLFHLKVTMASIILMSLCLIIKDSSHPGRPLHLASDALILKGDKTAHHLPTQPHLPTLVAPCPLLQCGTSWA